MDPQTYYANVIGYFKNGEKLAQAQNYQQALESLIYGLQYSPSILQTTPTSPDAYKRYKDIFVTYQKFYPYCEQLISGGYARGYLPPRALQVGAACPDISAFAQYMPAGSVSPSSAPVPAAPAPAPATGMSAAPVPSNPIPEPKSKSQKSTDEEYSRIGAGPSSRRSDTYERLYQGGRRNDAPPSRSNGYDPYSSYPSSRGGSSSGPKSYLRRGPGAAAAKQQQAQARAEAAEKHIEALRKKVEESEHCKALDKELVGKILLEFCQPVDSITFDDIAGLEEVKKALREIVIIPAMRPDLFRQLDLEVSQGLLLFGPPGNGKTMIAVALANESKSAFISVSASTLVSKWVGESEKMVRALFSIARALQPTIVFIDEVDSMLTARSSGEHDQSRRLKTEFLAQMQGFTSSSQDRVLVMAATNCPQDLDSAVLRRFPSRIYVPMPTEIVRKTLVELKLRKMKHTLSPSDVQRIVRLTEGYSASDLSQLCKDVRLAPIRDLISTGEIESVAVEDVRPITYTDFEMSAKKVRPSLDPDSIQKMMGWAREHGSVGL